MIDKDEILKLIDELSLLDDIKASDIPDMNLYMEQVTTFIEDNLSHLKREEGDKLLTKTMINNYTKSGILMSPVNKKYSKQHVILLIIIYYLKQILSINDIRTLLKPILNNVEDREDDVIPLTEIYSTFTEIKNNEFKNYYSTFNERLKLIESKTKDISEDNKDIAQLFLIVIMLVAQADALKRLSERIIDNYFKEQN